jgi:hypothetical protein
MVIVIEARYLSFCMIKFIYTLFQIRSMSGFFRKKKVKKALEKARELEKHKPMPKEQVVKIYKEGISFGEKIKSFLKPSWFVADPHSKKKVECKVLKKAKTKRAVKKRKAVKKAKKSTRKRRKKTKKKK